VLTDQRYFGGNLADLRRIASQDHCLPLLRKDFIFDPYQVYEARAAGADAILLIAAALHRRLLQELHDLSLQYGLMPLIEVHNRRELDLALNCRPRLIGINNRNLADFSISLNTFLNLRPLVPEGILVVAESGIHSSEDVRLLARAGANAILVGEGLVTAGEIGRKVREIAGLEV
jgi:indole-3-glycerol phosphate synthase